MNDAFIARIIEFAFFAAFAQWRLGISDYAYVTLVGYASKKFSTSWILRAIALRLLMMQPKDDTLICIEAHEGPLGPD